MAMELHAHAHRYPFIWDRHILGPGHERLRLRQLPSHPLPDTGKRVRRTGPHLRHLYDQQDEVAFPSRGVGLESLSAHFSSIAH